MAVRDDAGGGTGSAGRRRERRLRSFLRHGRMAIAMMLAECTHHSAQRQKKASVTEFFAMPSENSVEDQMLEDGVFQEIMKIDVETPAVLEQVIQEFPEVQFNFSFQLTLQPDPPQKADELPEVQVVERPPRTKMAALLMGPSKTVPEDEIQQQTGVQTVDTPACRWWKNLWRQTRARKFHLSFTRNVQNCIVSVKATTSGRKENWALLSWSLTEKRERWSLCCERRTR